MRGWRGLCVALFLLVAPIQAPEASSQPLGRLVADQLRSANFADSKIGVSPLRKLTVYLPPGYLTGVGRYPVLYYLNHFFEGETAPFANHGATALFDRAIGQGVIGEFIVVTADFSTPAGSSWYVNSSATGYWEDFMVGELVPYVDARYRTLPSRNSRGVVGDGVGAYGAIRFGMRHPEVFGSVYGMQLIGAGGNIQTTHSRPNWERLAQARSLDDLGHDGFSRIFTSIYQATLPNSNRPPLFFDPPARSLDGRVVVDTAVMARFLDRFSLAAQLPLYAENLKTLRGLKFDWGRADPIVDHIYGSQAFAHLLDEYGVPHEAEEHGGGFRDRHWGETGRVYTDVLPFFARHLVFEDASR